MTTELTTTEAGVLVLAEPRPIDQRPAAVCSAGLAPSSRRTMRESLDTIAGLVSNGQADALTLDWPALRFQHMAAIRAKLAEIYAPATGGGLCKASMENSRRLTKREPRL
jgi:hypothetical protein